MIPLIVTVAPLIDSPSPFGAAAERAHRRLFLAFALTATLGAILPVLAASDAATTRTVIAVGLAAMAVRRLAEHRRGRLPGVGWDLPEAAVVLAAVAVGGIHFAVAPAYGSILFHCPYGSRRRTAVATVVFAISATAGATLDGHVAAALPHVFGLVATGALLRIAMDTAMSRAAALEKSERFTAAVLDSMDAGVVACDAAGVINVFNRAARGMHTAPAQPLPPSAWVEGFGLHDIRPVDGSETTLEDLPLFRALRGEIVRGVQVNYGEGTEQRVAVVNAQPIEDGGGGRLGAVAVMHDVTENARSQERLEHAALHDPLTGLGNRALLRDRLEHARSLASRRGDALAVLLVDLDDFKMINDTHGHEIGDRVLVEISERFNTCVRASDTLVRLGGDEFAVLLEGGCHTEAQQVAERLHQALDAPIVVGNRTFRMSVSIGIADTTDGGQNGGLDLFTAADVALYRAKASGRGRVSVFERAMRGQVMELADLEADLRAALDARALEVHYQPIVDVTTEDVVAFEALARWPHPTRGEVGPDQFIPIAERAGLVSELGQIVLHDACSQAAAWNAHRSPSAQLSVGVNLSAVQLREPSLAGSILAALDVSGLDPYALVLEVTESTLMQIPQAMATLREVRRHGVRLAVDDFGTGYSSLARLHVLAPDILKIDRTFISAISTGEVTIVNAIMNLAHSLGITSVAEGVERPEELAHIRRHGCQRAQGHLFATALHPDAATALVLNGHR